MRSERGLELALGLLGGGLAFGESSLEAGLFGDMRVGGGHGQEAEEREGEIAVEGNRKRRGNTTQDCSCL